MKAVQGTNEGQRGALIVVEGLDRAGKSTQCAILQKTLQEDGHEVKYRRFPDRTTEIGKMINAYLMGNTHLDDHAIHLLFSANRWEAATEIQQDISNGITVIIDRYSYSGVVYSAAKDIPGLSLDWAWQPEIGLPQPDIWLFLNISPEEAAKRGGYGLERYENDTFQSRIRQLFQTLIAREDPDNVHIIDAGRTEREVALDVIETARKAVENVCGIRSLRKFGPLLKPANTQS
ncbi:thymidylate kinase [Blastomyces dermatitidis ER-3]|uniref:Thymidylate kinase n=2 Tax=Blastomyces TaxID=229219 RepID=A0A179UAL4_BLAGS|nr:thymidylate kinase [Blastomyces gilchristii SLH14081]XP_045276228.1 thymidylate kinase [Blastomyces dermatitidis ER-3]EEQ89269.1 thymidylate kinase [Blastomyces dermatitidis ER-3]EQL33418.1 dTMP kinase [Blastomyces dermatitidis ATCC 26199]OAT04880.1 thymidylate kinase [Blastomyces gilchristii SLH14081]